MTPLKRLPLTLQIHDKKPSAVRIMTTPRCKAIFTDDHVCQKPCLRLNKKRLDQAPMYTDHCIMHGGKQERDHYCKTILHDQVKHDQAQTETDMINALGITDGHDQSCSHDQGRQATDQNPKATGGPIHLNTTSTDLPTTDLPTGGTPEKVEPKNFGQVQNNSDPEDNMYSIPDRTLRGAFEKKLGHSQALNLNQELALCRALIQQIVTAMNSKNLSAQELGKLDKLMMRADHLLNTIMKVESMRKVMYTRESLKMDVMKVVGVIRKLIPEEDRRRLLATELARILGPTLANSGDIIVSREVFKRG